MHDIVIIGAGPSGLAAAVTAVEQGARVVVIEKLTQVGGLARTIAFEGSRYDIGPHRFFTRNAEVQRLFVDTVAEDAIRVARLTRIFYRGRFFNYPLTPVNATLGVGLAGSVGMAASYAAARLRRSTRPRPIETFEDWVVDRFGRAMFERFFKTYTEKLWGVPCDRISAAWAEQRIKGLSLRAAVSDALFGSRGKIKTLVNEFLYPRLGSGQLYEKLARRVAGQGSLVLTDATVARLRAENGRVVAAEFIAGDGTRDAVEGRSFLVSAPLAELAGMIDPAPAPGVRDASAALRHRLHICVNLEIEGPSFPDNWIYVHAGEVRMVRVANYANFSPAMSATPAVSPVTVEYFAFPGDATAATGDDGLIRLATAELAAVGLVQPDQVRKGFVVRSDKAYPVIERGCEDHVAVIRAWLEGFANLLPIGRSGMFKYNNQDHAMFTGMLGARTALGLGAFDPWRVNIDAEYHEGAPAR